MRTIPFLPLVALAALLAPLSCQERTRYEYYTPAGSSGATTGGSSTGTGTGGTTGATTPPPPSFLVSGWHASFSPGSGRATIDTHHAAIDEVNPTWYTIAADGTLRPKGSFARDRQFVDDMHAYGIEVAPMIDDFAIGGAGPVVRDPSLAATLRASILAEVAAYDLDGVDIDFEGMGQISRDAFSDFMALLAADLHAQGKYLSAAIYPKTSEPGGWSGPQSHDYLALGQSVDRFKIMMYGFSGPMAPVDYMDRVLAFATALVPAHKIYAGVPFYGRDRNLTTGAKPALTEKSAEALRAQVGSPPARIDVSGETTFDYTDANGHPHAVWYQTGDSMRMKIAVAKRWNTAGIAIWRLGDELTLMQAIADERTRP